VYFAIKVYCDLHWSGAKPLGAGEFSRIFVLKVSWTLQLLLTVSYRNKKLSYHRETARQLRMSM